MKRILLSIITVALSAACLAGPKWGQRVEVSELGILGKAFDTPNPYHRIDTAVYKGFTPEENAQCRVPAGLAVVFRTDATDIGIAAEFGDVRFVSYMSFDLYIKKDGKWL